MTALVLFFLLAFLFSWLELLLPFQHPILAILAVAGPTFAAIIAALYTRGRAGVDELFSKFLLWRVSSLSWLAAVLGQPAIGVLAVGLVLVFTQATADFLSAIPWATIPAFFLNRLLINVWEEVGWRGFALPRLQRRFSALVSSLILGALWALWHVPLYLAPGGFPIDVPFYIYFADFVIVSILYTWLYNTSKGSILMVTLFHVMGNLIGWLLLNTGLNLVHFLTARLLVVLLIAAVLAWRYGPAHLSREKRLTAG